MEELKNKINSSGLKQKYIAEKVNISPAHLTMMLKGNATMPDEKRIEILELLKKQKA